MQMRSVGPPGEVELSILASRICVSSEREPFETCDDLTKPELSRENIQNLRLDLSLVNGVFVDADGYHAIVNRLLELSTLRTLEIDGNQIQIDVDFLAVALSYTRIRRVLLFECNLVSGKLSPLAELPYLEELFLSFCNTGVADPLRMAGLCGSARLETLGYCGSNVVDLEVLRQAKPSLDVYG